MKVADIMKNRIHTGLTSSPEIKITKDYNKEAFKEAAMQKFSS
jgi:hypothetical protein